LGALNSYYLLEILLSAFEARKEHLAG
jgi:hypothetical protein